MRPPVVVITALALVSVLPGCADPYGAQTPPRVDGEQPAPAVRERAAAPRGQRSTAALIRRAVELSGNWTSDTVADRYARFAELTVGPTRRRAAEAAARVSTDRQLTAPGSTSTTTLESLTLRKHGAERSAIVVTRERLHADGRTTIRWRVTLATAVPTRYGWALARWEPQP